MARGLRPAVTRVPSHRVPFTLRRKRLLVRVQTF